MSEPREKLLQAPGNSVGEAGCGGDLGRASVDRAEQRCRTPPSPPFVLPPASHGLLLSSSFLLTTALTPHMGASGFQLPVRDEAGPEANQVSS